MTFFVTFAYLQYERTYNFQWALTKVQGLFVEDDVLPQVIVTNRDLALMNALKSVFPSSTNLLSILHYK